jgi:hypothetical protein
VVALGEDLDPVGDIAHPAAAAILALCVDVEAALALQRQHV